MEQNTQFRSGLTEPIHLFTICQTKLLSHFGMIPETLVSGINLIKLELDKIAH